MGSRLVFDVVVALTSLQVALAGEVASLKPILNVCSPATYMALPEFQSTPIDGSPAPLPPRVPGTV
jgi:hypothetical protein